MRPGVIEVVARDGAALVRVRSDIDATVADPLRRVLAEASDRHCPVVLDLGDAPAIDSAGLGALVRAHRRAHRSGGVLCLAGPSRYVLTVLHTMKVDPLFPTFDDVSAALAWIRLGAPQPALG